MMLRLAGCYRERAGRPSVIPLLPGPREARITVRGTDPVVVGGLPLTLRRFDVESVVWGRETVWLIVLNADPLADISNIRTLRWVVAKGRVMEPSGLWRAAGFR